MIGHNRYDIINSVKPLITNPTVEIHAKNINPYNVPNTTAYMLTTNFQNALPLDDNDRRYFILMSQWQDGKALTAFQNENPDYFADLYRTLDESPGAILGWLKLYKLHPDFQPRGRAPHSHSRALMAELNKPAETLSIDDLIEEGRYHGISNDLIVVSKLTEILVKRTGMALTEQAIRSALQRGGFSYLGRPKIHGKKEGVWTKNPAKFGHDQNTRFMRVRDFLENPL
jgi:hypothetical protein